MGHPNGVKSNLKRMEWEEQIAATSIYLKYGYYPASILENKNVMRRKRMKRDFCKMSESYKFIDNKLRKLKVLGNSKMQHQKVSENELLYFIPWCTWEAIALQVPKNSCTLLAHVAFRAQRKKKGRVLVRNVRQ